MHMHVCTYIYMPYDQHARHTTTDLPEQGTRPQTEVALAADCFSIKSIHQATKHMVKLIHRLPVGTEAAGLGYNAPNCDDLGLGTSKNEPHQTKSAKRNIGSKDPVSPASPAASSALVRTSLLWLFPYPICGCEIRSRHRPTAKPS